MSNGQVVRKRKQGAGTGARASTNSPRGGSSAEGSGYPEKGSPGNSNGQYKGPGVRMFHEVTEADRNDQRGRDGGWSLASQWH